jgi:hypothetical protein
MLRAALLLIPPNTSIPTKAYDKVKAAPWFDPAVRFLFIFFATLNKGESHKTEGRRFSPFFAGGSGG